MLTTVLALWLTVDGVRINDKGPFRFLIDTGAQSTVIDPAVAGQLALRPSYRVEVVSVNGSMLAPAAEVTSVSVDGVTAKDVEVLWYGLAQVRSAIAGVDGVLGQNFLSLTPHLLDFRKRTVRLGGAEMAGERVPIEFVDGRPVVTVDGLRLALDSGAHNTMLFREVGCWRGDGTVAVITTSTGASQARVGRIKQLRVGSVALRDVPAGLMAANAGIDGILALNVFEAVYINPAGGYAVFTGNSALRDADRDVSQYSP
ncbi:MAG: retroviral-like aspartic protease family protein [Bryobacteraceae bacterium]|nr:retroviral-like aspartic protease family protein [Bryobacteraceae bacterium]